MIYNLQTAKLSKGNLDVYLTQEYYELAQFNKEGVFEFFKFEYYDNIAIYPFLLNPINGFDCVQNDKFFDIQTVYGYGGIITNSYELDFIQRFFQAFNAFCKKNSIVAEFVRFNPLLSNHTFSSREMEIIDDRQTVIVDLSLDYEEIFTLQYTSKGRNMIRKGRKLGYRSEFFSSPERALIEKFHEIYSENMRSVNADEFYFYSIDYFIELFKLLKDSAYLGVIYNQEGKIVCSSIFLHYTDFFHYHLSGRVRGADNSVNNFMIDEAVKFGLSCGANKFHLGGGLSNDEQDRLFKFKTSFSKERGIFKIGKRVHDQNVYDTLIQEWAQKNPEKTEQFKNHLLKYRF